MRRRSDIPYVQRQAAKRLAEQAAETARRAEDIARVEREAANPARGRAGVARHQTPGGNHGPAPRQRIARVLSRLTDEFEAMAAEDGQDAALARLSRRVAQIMEG